MPDPAQINRSIGIIHTELAFLRDAGLLSAAQLASITAQLPQAPGAAGAYTDTKFSDPAAAHHFDPSRVAQQAQDPAHPAHPQHPRHAEWARRLAGRFGSAVMFGAGATLGGDVVNDAFHHLGG